MPFPEMFKDLLHKNVFFHALSLAVLVALPFLLPGITHHAVMLLMYMTLAIGWNLQGGYLGDISFGHVSFFGIAAYTAALLEHYHLLHLAPVNILLGALLASAFAVVIGSPFLRLRGFYFAIGTLGLSNLLFLIYKNILSSITLGATGVMVPPPQPYHIETFYYGALLIAVLSMISVYLIIRSRIGLAFSAIRDERSAAQALGVNVTYYRVLGFAVSACITGAAGGFYAYYGNYVNPEGVFSPSLSFEMLVMVTLGGGGTLSGPILGALLLYVLEEVGRTYIQQGYYILPALMLVIVFMFIPGGMASLMRMRSPFPRFLSLVRGWKKR